MVLKLEERTEELEVINGRLQSVEGETIKFYNLVVPSKVESDVWVELHSPGGKFGCIVNFHIFLWSVFII